MTDVQGSTAVYCGSDFHLISNSPRQAMFDYFPRKRGRTSVPKRLSDVSANFGSSPGT